MAELRGVEILQSEINRSRDRLKGFNENIKKLTGHENPGPRGRRIFGSEGQDYDDGFSGRMGRGRGRLFGVAKRGLLEESGPPVKRRVVGGAFSRLGPLPVQRRVREESPEEEELPTRSVHSSVVATSRDAKNRQEIMQEQTKDKEGMQRNRRMFGLLLGTLNKFKTDSKTMESKEEQRKRIDQKLEENAEKEKKKFKQDTIQLMEERHLEQTRISRLEQKMEVVEEHADVEKEIKKLKNFLCTKTKPRIFWMPRHMNSAAENKLKDSIKVVDEMLRASQDRLEKDIKDVMEREHKREERIKMRLREDGLFLDEEENKEKENDEKERRVENVRVIADGDDGIESLEKNDRSDDEPEEKASVRKLKSKRRIVVEVQSNDESETEDEDDEIKGESKEMVKKGKKDDGESVEEPKKGKTQTKGNRDSDEHNVSGSNDDTEHSKKSKNHGKKHDKSNSRGNNRKEEDRVDNDEENSRVVLYRETKDKKKSEDGKKDSDNERSERRHHGDKHKHSHRRSKHSRKDSETVVIKEERDEKSEKKKSKTSERTVVEENRGKDGSSSDKRNPMNLMGEVEDVEMESENNVTM